MELHWDFETFTHYYRPVATQMRTTGVMQPLICLAVNTALVFREDYCQ